MQSPKPPQIIVIPHNLLQQQKSLLKISPSPSPITPYRVITTSQPTLNKAVLSSSLTSSASHMTLNRAVLAPSLSTSAFRPVQSSVSRPIAAVIGSKRPAPSLSPISYESDLIKHELESDSQPARKRANLDHLSPEERLMRRKLKNRVAAQTARDKKKAQTDDMERLISELAEEKQRMMEENDRLQAVNSQLQVENAALQQENAELKSRMSQTTDVKPDDVLELELPPSPFSLPPTSPTPRTNLLSPPMIHTTPLLAPASPHLQPPESAVLTYDPQQQEQGCRCQSRPRMSSQHPHLLPGLSSRDLTPWAQDRRCRADCLAVVLCALWCLTRVNSSQPQTSSQKPSLPPQLPPKKRAMNHLLSWTHNISLTPQPPE